MASCLIGYGRNGSAGARGAMPLIAPSVVQINQTGQPVNPDSLFRGRGREHDFAEKG
jgi:hypothetical protein